MTPGVDLRADGAKRLVKRFPSAYTMSVHKTRLGARPPRKRSAPVAGKRIRNDETPPKAGFRVFGIPEHRIREGASGLFRGVHWARAEVARHNIVRDQHA